jgi:cytoskeleton protein RodZ
MQTIGEKLLEARQKKGVSLRDASETTKIRADFLANFENDEFDFDLPEIYKRGFIHNYARFLKLHTESLLADYTAQRLNTVSRTRRDGPNELFGEIDLQPAKTSATKPADKIITTTNTNTTKTLQPRPVGKIDDFNDGENTDKPTVTAEDKLLYLKIGTVLTGVIVAILIIIWLFSLIGGNNSNSSSITNQPIPSQTRPAAQTPASPTASTETLILHASGNVYAIVDEPHSGTEHFRGNLTAGQSRRLAVTAPIRIRLTAGENLEFEFRNERIRPSREGTGIINLP